MKDKLLLIIAGLQPIIWWGVYNIFQPIANTHNSEFGLGAACVISGGVIMFSIIVPIVDKTIK